MTAFDYAVLAVVGVSLLLGAWRGLFSEVLALLAWVVAFFAGRALAADVAPVFAGWMKDPALQYVAGFALIFIAVILVAGLLRLLVSRLLRAIGLGPLDRFLGALFGVVRGVAIVLIAVAIAGLTAVPHQPWWREATLAPPLETAVVAAKPWLPQAVAKRIRYR